MVGKVEGINSYVPGYEGGIVTARNSSFINNQRSLSFLPYQNIDPNTSNEVDNKGEFEDCNFKIQGNLDYLDLDWFVYLADVNGIKFYGCDFRGESSNIVPFTYTKGIWSVGSSFRVAESDTRDSYIENLRYGIQAYSMFPGNMCYIRNCKLVNNYTGIYLSAMNGSAIINNNFTINVPTGTNPNPLLCGLYLDNCTGYQVEENTLYSTWDEVRPDPIIGIAINNSGGADNLIYNNNCHGFYAGILAQDINRDNELQTGLFIQCNEFNNCGYDIAVTTDDENNEDSRIRSIQGSDGFVPQELANNIFSYTNSNNYSDYNNKVNDIIYYYPQNQNNNNLQPINYSPRVNPLANQNVTEPFDKEEFCPPSRTSGGGTIEENRSLITQMENKIDSTQTLLNVLIDDGDTYSLTQEVETSMPSQAVDLRDDLINASPYLSDSVMISAIEKENVLTEPIITEILIANPQSAKSDSIQQALDNRFNQLSDDQRTDIDQGWFVSGAKESLESNLVFYKSQREKALNNIIRIFRTDTNCFAPTDSIISVLAQENSLRSQYDLAFEYYKLFDTTNAFAVLNAIPSNYSLGSSELIENQQYISCMNFLIQLNNNNKSMFEIDSIGKQFLYDLLDDSKGHLKALVRNILINIDTLIYQEPYILPGDSLKSNKVKRIPIRKSYNQDYFSIYPNPAGSYVIIEYTLKKEENITKGKIRFIDNKGTVVKAVSLSKPNNYLVVRIDDLPNGVYYCNFVINEIDSQTKKLIISR